MAHGELSTQEFAEFNRRWMENALGYLMDGGLLGTFIDWRSVELVLACGRELGLDLVNIIVWSKPNAGQGSLWRSAHELLPIFKGGRQSMSTMSTLAGMGGGDPMSGPMPAQPHLGLTPEKAFPFIRLSSPGLFSKTLCST